MSSSTILINKILVHRQQNTQHLSVGYVPNSCVSPQILNILPSPFDNFFTRSSEIHSHDLRTVNRFRSEFASTTLKHFSNKCSGPRIYSSIPKEVTSCTSTSTFRAPYKLHSLDTQTSAHSLSPSHTHFHLVFYSFRLFTNIYSIVHLRRWPSQRNVKPFGFFFAIWAF